VHTTSGGEKMEAFVKEQGVSYPVCIDKDNGTKKAYAVDSYPDYYLIDRAGKLRFADLANGELERAVKLLVAEEPPAKEKTKSGIPIELPIPTLLLPVRMPPP
jgi:hypothetical protein